MMTETKIEAEATVKGEPVLGAMLEAWMLVMGYVCGYRVSKDGKAVRDLTKKDGAEMLLAMEATAGERWPGPLREKLLDWNEGELDLEDFKKRYPGPWSVEAMTAEVKGLLGEQAGLHEVPGKPEPLLPGLERVEVDDDIPF